MLDGFSVGDLPASTLTVWQHACIQLMSGLLGNSAIKTPLQAARVAVSSADCLMDAMGEVLESDGAVLGKPLGILKTLERRAIVGVLETCRGNQRAASKMLGISRQTLRNKLRSYADIANENQKGVSRGKKEDRPHIAVIGPDKGTDREKAEAG